MRILLFLILGTVLFGFAFPAFILLVLFLLFIFCSIAIIRLFTGMGGGRMIIYHNGRRVDGGANREAEPSRDAYDFGEEAEGEVVELPSSALSKEDEKDNSG